MKKLLIMLSLAVLAMTANAAPAQPEERLVIQLKGAAAACALAGLLATAELSDNSSQAEVNHAGMTANQCVEDQLATGESEYRRALEAAPGSKALLVPVYSTWLQHMRSLRNPWATDEHVRLEAQFEGAVSDMTAGLVARITPSGQIRPPVNETVAAVQITTRERKLLDGFRRIDETGKSALEALLTALPKRGTK